MRSFTYLRFFLFVLLLSSLFLISLPVSAKVLKAVVRQGILPQTKPPNGWIPAHLIFTFRGKSYTALLNIKATTYNQYSQQTRLRSDPRIHGGQAVAVIKFSNEGKVDVQPLAKALYKAAPDKKSETLAAFILSFVQALPYKSDALTSISDETWRSPLQTLVDPGVDCEDSSILYTSLMSAVQQDSALVIVPGHMLTAISGRYTGKGFKYQNKRYYFAETTSSGWSIGSLPPQIQTDFIHVFSINAYSSGKRKGKKIKRLITSKRESMALGGGLLFLILFFISGLAIWFAWDYGWLTTSMDEEEQEDSEKFFNNHEDSWK